MRVTLSHITAAYHWLMTPMDGHDLAGLERRSTLGLCPARVRELSRLDFLNYEVEGLQTEFLTTDSSSCPRPDKYRYHVSSKDFPRDAFVILDPDVQIASPELSFVQMSYVLPIGELTKFAAALCGKVSFTIGDDGRLIKREVPLTTVKKLEAFLRSMGANAGNKNAMRALRYVVEGAESPMEINITVLLCLKRQYGGFGFPKPEMGHEVELDEIGRSLVGQETCRCDMYWPEANYDYEYDSKQEHSDAESNEHDSLRRQAIKHMGIEVGELRRVQVIKPEAFETAVKLLAKDLGIRLVKRSADLEFKHSCAYLELRRQLFWWEREAAGEDPSPLHVADLCW